MFLKQTKISQQLISFVLGIIHSLNMFRILMYLYHSKNIRKLFAQTFLLNSSLLIFAIIIHRYNPFHILIAPIFWILFFIIYSFSLILNSFWISDMYSDAILIEKNIYKNSNIRNIQIDVSHSNEIQRFLLVMFFMAQNAILSQLPIIGQLINIIHLSFLYSIYRQLFNLSFEYKWGTDSHLIKNIAFFENHQSYFIGFGIIFALSTNLSFVYSICIFALIMPVFMLSSIPAAPPQFQNQQNNENIIQQILNLQTIQNINDFQFDWKQLHIFSLFYIPRRMLILIDQQIDRKVIKKL